MININRREFLKDASKFSLGLTGFLAFKDLLPESVDAKKPFFTISLAQWSLNRSLYGGTLDNLDFPALAKNTYDINIVEYVNQFFLDKAEDTKYLNELLKRCNDNGVTNHLIMCDGEGPLGDPDDSKRNKAVENHYKWVNAAKHLGCKTIRVNVAGEGSSDEVQKAGVDGLSKLGEYASTVGINVVVENHGGYTSNGAWIQQLMKKINKKNIGTLPDFGNFCTKIADTAEWTCIEEYDRYQGVQEMLPFAKGISAKTYDFDNQGNCVETDYSRMLKLIKKGGFRGIIGIEFEGTSISEEEGIKKTKALLEKALQ
jgi:L-ribulose-5-phosphate 3-epimerase UlaE